MHAIGFPTFRYKLICFVIAGVICGLAGVLLANHTDFISPALDALDALRRPDRDGGARRHGDGVRAGDRRRRVSGAGGSPAAADQPLADLFTLLTGIDASHAHEYWQLVLGPLFLLVVLFARGGIDGLLTRDTP